MSLRTSPTLAPDVLATHRPDAKQSVGLRTARGEAWPLVEIDTCEDSRLRRIQMKKRGNI